jgi:rRNA processing protein Gar1
VLIGKCSVKTQGKILVQLSGVNLPRMGSKAFITREGKQKIIGEVNEAIGLTNNPWIVISVKKALFQQIQVNEEIFTHEKPRTKKGQKYRRRKKTTKRRQI